MPSGSTNFLEKLQSPEPAVEILAAAFKDYPVMRHILKDSGALYQTHLEALLAFYCQTRLTRQWPLLGLRTGEKLVAAAGINEPEDIPWPSALHRIYENLGKTIGPDAIQRMEAFENQCDDLSPEFPHYFLGIIGVLPGQQGNGFARRLMEEIHLLSERHPASEGVCLSTETATNVPLYQHLGYKILAEADVGELHTWLMFRPNHASEGENKHEY